MPHDARRETVGVRLLRDMVSDGWTRFLSCGGTGTGRFAADNGLDALAEQ